MKGADHRTHSHTLTRIPLGTRSTAHARRSPPQRDHYHARTQVRMHVPSLARMRIVTDRTIDCDTQWTHAVRRRSKGGTPLRTRESTRTYHLMQAQLSSFPLQFHHHLIRRMVKRAPVPSLRVQTPPTKQAHGPLSEPRCRLDRSSAVVAGGYLSLPPLQDVRAAQSLPAHPKKQPGGYILDWKATKLY